VNDLTHVGEPAARPSGTRPIGIFDSGVGGLSILNEIRRELPAESLVYYADSAHCPYGSRTREELQVLAADVTRFLVGRGAKIVVVACNTASVAALAHLRATFAVPFVGVVPAVKPAALASRSNRVAVLATPATFQGVMFEELVETFAADVRVIRQVCPGLVELVERGVTTGPEVETRLRAYLQPALDEVVDTVVLGCTHYPHLRPVVESIVGPEVRVIDSGAAVARQVRRICERDGLLAPEGNQPTVTYYTSGDDLMGFRDVVKRLANDANPAVRRALSEG
jgi:glutamate racemase